MCSVTFSRCEWKDETWGRPSVSHQREERAGSEREPMATCWRPRMRNGRVVALGDDVGVVGVSVEVGVEVGEDDVEEVEDGEDGVEDDEAVVSERHSCGRS